MPTAEQIQTRQWAEQALRKGRPREALALCNEADHKGLALVTTEKDLVRLTGDDRLAHLAAHTHALAVTLAFENEHVSVRSVNIISVHAKRRNFRHNRKRISDWGPRWKKAIVTLAPGQSIEIFEGM